MGDLRLVATAIALIAGAGFWVSAEASGPISPYEQAVGFEPVNRIDELVVASLNEAGVQPAGLCSDEVFVRRVYLDVIGVLPKPKEVLEFLRDPRPDKRARLIEEMLGREAFADYWAMKWCDLLRVKAEHPINLWPNGVQAYHHWVRQSLAANKRYDQFARELLTSSGSNFRVPPVNFYRAIQGESASSIASAAALTFMGERVEDWPAQRRADLQVFFCYVAYKPTAEWKEQIIHLDPAPRPEIDAVDPDGKRVRIGPDEDPREVFADWLIRADNPRFTAPIANRIWAWLMGRGIVEAPDDFGPHNPPSHPELLAHLQAELVSSGYDLKHLYRCILNSRTYQQSSIPRDDDARAAERFAAYPVRRLEAEVLIDALVGLFGQPERYESPIPEPFTFVPQTQPTVAMADGSITSPFLELFGRPPRDTGMMAERSNAPTDRQALHRLNSTQVQKKIERGWRIRDLIARARGNRTRMINELYVTILSRRPTEAETAAAEASLKQGAVRNGVNDLAWALINSKEFLYRH